MDIINNALKSRRLVLIILFGCMFLLGCATPKQIARPDVGEHSSRVGKGTINDVVIQAEVLDNEQAIKLFNINMARRSVIPVLFVMTNKSKVGCELRREHFKALLVSARIEPAMPGRAAALLGV